MKVNSAIPFMSKTIKKLDEKELKRCFFESHPYQWKQVFKEIHGFPEDEKNTIGEILSFMQLKAADAAQRERNNQEQARTLPRRTAPTTTSKKLVWLPKNIINGAKS